MTFAHKDDDFDPKQLFVRSDWEPSPTNIPIEFRARVSHFLKLLRQQFRRRQVPSNLLVLQSNTLADLLSFDEFQIFPSDKNLGPCIIEKSEYITRTLLHLGDTATYLQLSQDDAERKVIKTETLIKSFLFIHALAISPANQTYLWRTFEVPDKFAHFYIIAKVHKTP
jgi:hypothetical protein